MTSTTMGCARTCGPDQPIRHVTSHFPVHWPAPGRAAIPAGAVGTLPGMDERVLAERLITYDTSTLDGLRSASSFVKGWLESRELEVKSLEHDGMPVVMVDVGARNSEAPPTVILHGHLDVVPA